MLGPSDKPCSNDTSFINRVAYELVVKEEKSDFQDAKDNYARQVIQEDNRMLQSLLDDSSVTYTRA